MKPIFLPGNSCGRVLTILSFLVFIASGVKAQDAPVSDRQLHPGAVALPQGSSAISTSGNGQNAELVTESEWEKIQSQQQPDKRKASFTENKSINLTSFSQIRTNKSKEALAQNEGHEQDPELGILFPNAPCNNCYEVLDKRTPTQKYFVIEGTDTKKFVLQSGQYPLHYKDAKGTWRTIRDNLQKDKTKAGVYATEGRPVEVKINTAEGYASLTSAGGSIIYNRGLELVFVHADGTEQSLGAANWSSYTAGDNGVRVKNAWPGIDIEMNVLVNSLKTNFVVHSAMPAYAAGKLVLKDHMQLGKGLALSAPMQQGYFGPVQVKQNNQDIFTIQPAVAYSQSGANDGVKELNYAVDSKSNILSIEVPGNLLDQPASAYPLVIDPLVSGTFSSGFTYNTTASWPPLIPSTGYCTNANLVTIPAAATLSDIQLTYTYYGPAGAAWSQSRIGFQINGGCSYFWLSCGAAAFSSGIPGDACGLTSSSFWSTGPAWGITPGCVPAYSCTSYTLPFQLLATQRQTSTAACAQTVYATASGFTVNVFGSVASLPAITPSGAATVCMPSTLTLSGSPAGGAWSSSFPGVATVPGGVVTGVSNGSTNIVYSASGCTTSIPVTVGTTPTVTGGTSICFPGSTTLTGTPAGGVWTSSLPSVATVAAGFVNGVSVGTTIINYNTGTCSKSVPVDVNNPASVTPTTQPTGITFSGTSSSGTTVNFTPNGSSGYLVIATTASSLSVAPVANTTYATGSSFGGGIVIQGSASGSSPAYVTSLLASNTHYNIFVFAFNNNCIGQQYNTGSPLSGGFNTCVNAPGTPTVVSAGANSISLSWTASLVGGGALSPINYNVYAYSDAALTTPVPGYPVAAGIGTTYTATGLASGTQYWFRVAPADACNIMSGTVSGLTSCAALASIPYLQTFDVSATVGDYNPNCMTSNVQNCILSGVQNNVTYLGTIDNNHTPAGMNFYSFLRGGACSTGWQNQWLLTPGFAMTAGTTYKLSFWYRTDGNNWLTLRVQYGSSSTVPTVTSTTMGGTTGPIGTTLTGINTTTYTQFIQTFTVPSSGTYYVGFDAASTIATSVLALDDIEICAVPNVTASNSTAPYCEPATVVLNSTGTSGAVTYAWSGPSSFTSTLAYPSITGLLAGTYTYSLTAVNDPISAGYGAYCSSTGSTTFTVSPPPAAITGTPTVCTGSTTLLADPVAGGTWSSSNMLVGTVDATGLVSGLTAGTTMITYSVGGCYTTLVVTVSTMPGAIVGNPIICLGSATTYSNSASGSGALWSSSNPFVAPIGNTTGTAIGVTTGTTTITCYTSSSCYVTAVVTVNPYPNAITGSSSVCVGSTTTLTSTTGGGIWTSIAPGTASVGITSGIVTGNTLGNATISYRVGGCSVTFPITVVATPAVIAGPTSICLGFPTTTFTNTSTGGTWTSSNTNVIIGSATGIATGNGVGTAIITYSLSAGCFATQIVTVLAAPAAITGTLTVCQGLTTTLSQPVCCGTWSSGSMGVATVGIASGIVTGVITGSTVAATAIITYTLPSGCISTAVVTVNPVPAAIGGTTSVCQGATTTLNDVTTGGTWSSGTTAVGTIDPATGVLYGVSAGTTIVTYSLGSATGCITTTIVTVNPLPAPITGANTVCAGSCTLQSSATTGGAWSNSPTAIASVSGAGNVCGITPGTTTVTYSLSTSCQVTKIVTVTPGAGPISGTTSVCVGNCTTLTSATGGTWSSSYPAICTISSGVVCGISAGTTNITNTIAGGCAVTTVVTVNPLPGPITGNLNVCIGSSTLLSCGGSGTWTSPSGNVSVDPASGVVTGLVVGTATVTFSLGTGCVSTAVVTVNALPAAITGSLGVCIGSTTTLGNATGGGGWVSDVPATATIGIGTGILSGISLGTTPVSYILAPSGCYVTAIATVNPLPTAITGTNSICVGGTTTLASTPTGGTWMSANTLVGTIDPSTGILTGIGSGTTTVSYTTSGTGCKSFTVISVNALPSNITGTPSVCEGSTTALSTTPVGGTWSSSNTAIATVSSTGVVSGISSLPAPGTVTIICTTGTGCSKSVIVTVNPLPAIITGTMSTCIGTSTTLGTTSTGGTWGSSTAVATVGAASGIVNGLTAGNITVSYTLSTGCKRSTIVTVYALPGSITGSLIVCEGSNAALSNTPTGGTWSSSNTAVGTIGSSSGIVTGMAGYGTTTITYTLGTGCIATAVETVNPLPAAISGTLSTCVGATTLLGSTSTGGTWTSGNTLVATVNSSTGLVSGISGGSGSATANITYTLSTGCRTTAVVTVYALPASITGSLSVCVNATTALANASAGGTWSSSNTAIGTVNSATGVVTGISASAPGTTTITYTLGSGCIKTAEVTVNALPTTITGPLGFCIGNTTALGSTPAGGTWSSSIPAVGSVNSGSGIVTGNSAGNTTITYTAGNGCYITAVATVYDLPAAITGTLTVCEGLTTTLSTVSTGGTWSTTSTNASVGLSSGIVTGINAGTAIITYTLGTGCVSTAIVTVNPLPAVIGGSLNVCEGLTTTLTESVSGGAWSSGAPSIASIDGTGLVSGHVAGTAVISYTLSLTGCVRTAIVTVNALPTTIMGSSGFCNLTSTTMTSTAPGGVTWGSYDPTIVDIDPVTGLATGVTVGTGTISATSTAGCVVTKTITIILAPYPISGPSEVCLGNTIALGNTVSGGTWSSSGPGVAPVGLLTGVVFGASQGTATIVYVLSTGCSSSHVVTVDPVPAGITGNLIICAGQTSAFSNTISGGTWASSDLSVGTIDAASGIATGIAAGTTTISYALGTGCSATTVLTVNPLPGPITGNFSICEGSTSLLSDTAAGGTWSSSAPGIAYVEPLTGLVYGISTPNAYITYTLGTGCLRTVQVTVSPLPTTIAGPHSVCQGESVTLTNATPGGAWLSTDGSIASIDGVGVVTGVSPGVVLISYMMPSGCAATILFTVNGIPAPITGSFGVCAGFSTNLTDATLYGTWSTDAAPVVGNINSTTGVFTGIAPGNANVTYTLPSGCKISAVVTVIVLPAAISGTPTVCEQSTTTLSDVAPGGTWSSSNTARATVGVTSGVVTGVSAGLVTITYHVGTGCFNVLTVTVNPLPLPITGNAAVCEGNTITLHSSSPLIGNWYSNNTSVANLDAPHYAGIVRGISGGLAEVVYEITATGCSRSVIVTVNALPAAIVGNNYVCLSGPIQFSDTDTTGIWSSTNTSVATISSTGLVTPISLGTTTISYTDTLGCAATRHVTVSPLPVVYTVTGGGSYCAGGAGMHVGLSSSQIGVSYVLYYGSSATGYLTGTGSALDFGPLTPGGVYTIEATYTSSGCTRNMLGSATISVTTPATPTVSISTGGNDSTCPGTSVTMTAILANGGTAPSYIWKVNGVTVSIGNNYTYIPANGDFATVVMTSNAACIASSTASAAKILTVLPTATPVVSIAADPGDTICQFNPVTYTASPMYGGTSPEYRWLVNGLYVGTGTTYSYVPVNNDVVSVRMVSNYMCRLADTVSGGGISMTVDSILLPHVSIAADSGLITGADDPVTLRATATNAGPHPTYQWKINGHLIAGATNDSYTDVFHDYDSINCVVVSSGICHNIGTLDWVFITVFPTNVQHVAIGAGEVRLVPNPNKGTFAIKGALGTANDEELNLEITDMLGQVVYKGKTMAMKGKIDQQIMLSGTLANGMYLLSISAANEHMVLHFVMEQ